MEGLQAYVREHCRLAKCFEALVRTDKRFEICNKVRVRLRQAVVFLPIIDQFWLCPHQVGLVCFRLIGSDELNQMLLSTINSSGKLHMVPASVNEKFVIRFCVCAQNATDDHISENSTLQILINLFFNQCVSYLPTSEYAWETIAQMATDVIKKVTLSKQVIAAFQTPSAVTEHKRLQTVSSMPNGGTEEARSLLAKKRSFFVRMVSDPKIYNPKIVVNAGNAGEGIDEEGESTANSDEDNEKKNNEEANNKESGGNKPDVRKGVVRRQNGRKSWISWPLAFILASGNSSTRRNADVATMAEKAWSPSPTEKEVSMRYMTIESKQFL